MTTENALRKWADLRHALIPGIANAAAVHLVHRHPREDLPSCKGS
jgi:hypothetical protein